MVTESRGPPPSPRGGGKALRRALTFLRLHRLETGGALSALLLVSGANLAAPQVMRFAIDEGSVGTVKSQTSRALSTLRTQLGEDPTTQEPNRVQ